MCDSIIFDMDGTLVNFLDEMLISWNLTCKNHGWNKVIEFEELKSCMGLNGRTGAALSAFPPMSASAP